MVSFDVVSLFTAVPVKKACECIRKKLNEDTTLHLRTSLTTDDIVSLLEFTLSNNYFVYNDSIYKQIHGCTMGSPVSAVVANLCMKIIEETAITASSTPPKIWKRYINDSFVIIKKHSVASFHDTLNSIDPEIAFTIEPENNGQIPFLDTLVSRNNDVITIDVYRKSTHTDRYLDFYSHHEMKQKLSTATTLLNCASNLPSTPEGKTKELIHVTDALKSKSYPLSVISNILKKKPPPATIPSPEEVVGMFFGWADPSDLLVGFTVLPYIKGLTEPLSRLLRNNGIQTTSRPLKALQQEFVSLKSRPPAKLQTNVVYKIRCTDCPWSYIGETGRCLQTRKKEHIRNMKTF